MAGIALCVASSWARPNDLGSLQQLLSSFQDVLFFPRIELALTKLSIYAQVTQSSNLSRLIVEWTVADGRIQWAGQKC